ncbi:MAG: thioredoxin family protein [Patescibacteria group bacterium]
MHHSAQKPHIQQPHARQPQSRRPLLLVALALFLAGAGFYGQQRLCQTAVAAPFCEQERTTTSSSKRLAESYLEYSPEALQSAHNQENTVVLYFWAPWCSTCSTLDHDLQDGIAQVPDDITLLRVNYDEETELKQRFNVVTQHTFVQLTANNEPITVWVGGEIEELVENLEL